MLALAPPLPHNPSEFRGRSLAAIGDPDWGYIVNPNRPPSGDAIARLGVGQQFLDVDGSPLIGFQGFDIVVAGDSDSPSSSFQEIKEYRTGARWMPFMAETRSPIVVSESRVLPPLSVHGTEFRASGARFNWKGATAFDMGVKLAKGDDSYLRWLAGEGFSILRVVLYTFYRHPRSAEDGLSQLPLVLKASAAHGLYVEAVINCDTAVFGFGTREIEDITARAGVILADHTNGIGELGNELDHGVQSPAMRDAAFLAKLRRLIPAHIPVAYGSSGDDRKPPKYTGGDYSTAHGDRQVSPEDNAAKIARDQTALGHPVVDDEWRGMGEQAAGESRFDDPDLARRQAAAAKAHGLATTFHHHAGLWCSTDLLGPKQREAARLFVEELS